MKNAIKNLIYKTAYIIIRVYWRVFKPVTHGARILLVTDTKILLVQPRALKYWNIPGGGIKRKENPEQGAIRELYEETGIKIDSVDYLLGTYISSDEGKHDTIYFYIKRVEQELSTQNDIEIGNSGWFHFDQLPDGTTSRTKMRIQEYLEGMRNIEGLYKELHL